MTPAVASPESAPAPRTLATTAPAHAILPERSALAPAPGEPIASHYRWCFGCGDQHPTGLHLVVIAEEGLALSATFNVSDMHQGAPGLAHGGLLTTAFDETLGALNWLLATPAVTGRLECDFRRPVPVGTTLHIAAHITGVAGRKVFTRATGRIGAADGPLAVTAAALFIQVSLEHFVANGRPEDVEAARADRQVRNSLNNIEVAP